MSGANPNCVHLCVSGAGRAQSLTDTQELGIFRLPAPRRTARTLQNANISVGLEMSPKKHLIIARFSVRASVAGLRRGWGGWVGSCGKAAGAPLVGFSEVGPAWASAIRPPEGSPRRAPTTSREPAQHRSSLGHVCCSHLLWFSHLCHRYICRGRVARRK